MSLKMNLWSLTLQPGEAYPVYVRRDFQITNAALGEELASADGRSVVKVTHNPINPAMFESDDEFDSDYDSEDDEELDDDEDEEMVVEELQGKKTEKKAEKKAEAAAETEEEDDEEEDSDDEDLDLDEELEETNVICSLTAGKTEQTSLNLTFVEGEVVMFEVTGENEVHLLGNYIDQGSDSDSDSEYDSEFDGSDDYSELYGSDDDIELDSEEEAAVASKITEIPTEAPKSKKAIAAKTEAPVADKKRKAEAIESPAKPETENLSKAQKKKLAKKAKTDVEAPVAASAPAKKEEKKEKPAAKKEQKRTLASGLIIEDIKVGDGPAAKTGKRLGMRYIGKLTTGKQFDANTSGKPFSFVLGKGEVIRGWDEGLAGMCVGGERRLTIPPQLAYGSQKIPGIPKNSTLKFDVKLVSIN